MISSSLERSFIQTTVMVESWLYDISLPFWAQVGTDQKFGGFIERLDLRGNPIDIGYKRTRVTARQIFVFCQAYMSGYKKYGSIIEHGVHFLLNSQKGDIPGTWKRTVSSSGQSLDDTIDLYDHAFVLFGLAWWYRVSNERKAKILAIDTLNSIRNLLKHPSGIGYCHEISALEPYQQNPHMHLMEALIEWFDITNDQIFYDELMHIFNLFRNKFLFQGTLREYFRSDWTPLGCEEGTYIELGHMAEWAWILKRYSNVTGSNCSDLINDLMSFVKLFTKKNPHGFLFNVVNSSLDVINSNFRLWPQMEFVKGLISEFKDADQSNSQIITEHILGLFTKFIQPAPKGCWLEHIDANGLAIVNFIPSSSLYHITCSLNEFIFLTKNKNKSI